MLHHPFCLLRPHCSYQHQLEWFTKKFIQHTQESSSLTTGRNKFTFCEFKKYDSERWPEIRAAKLSLILQTWMWKIAFVITIRSWLQHFPKKFSYILWLSLRKFINKHRKFCFTSICAVVANFHNNQKNWKIFIYRAH